MANRSSRGDENRSISIGGNVKGSAIVTGDRSQVEVSSTTAVTAVSESVDMLSEIAALREILKALRTADAVKIASALSDVDEELAKPEPDRDRVGKALTRAFEYAKQASGFADATAKLIPHLKNVVGWLGHHWQDILRFVGFPP